MCRSADLEIEIDVLNRPPISCPERCMKWRVGRPPGRVRRADTEARAVSEHRRAGL